MNEEKVQDGFQRITNSEFTEVLQRRELAGSEHVLSTKKKTTNNNELYSGKNEPSSLIEGQYYDVGTTR